jgi:DNA repair protein RecO
MHHIYQTEAFVLKTVSIREADKLVTLLTKDFGLIKAIAQGLRYEKSKLRFAIQDYSKANISLVKGKNDIWRITNAQAEKNLFFSLSEDNFKVIVRIFKLLERFIVGEENDIELFDIVDGGINYLEAICLPEPDCRQADLGRHFLLDFESLFVLRILNRLGYIGENKNLNFYILDNKWENSLIEKMNKERKEALRSINEAIRQSQL